jgi:hypothetical protein
MKASTSYDVTGKARTYHTLAQMSSSFSSIVRYCEDLEQAGVLTPRYKRRFQAFALEVQAEINGEILEYMNRIEMDDWARFGRIREKWEKYLRFETEPGKRRAKKKASTQWSCGFSITQLPNYSITKF